MTEQADLEQMLRSILGELRPYQSDIVLIGGWVPYLYRHYGGFKPWRVPATLTFELDLLVPAPGSGGPHSPGGTASERGVHSGTGGRPGGGVGARRGSG
jgi:hypothetical protein